MDNTATRDELARRIAQDTGISIAAARIQVDNVINGLDATLRSGKSVTLRGFGAFKIVERAGRTYTPGFGSAAPVTVPSRNAVSFKPAAELRAAVAAK